MSEHRISRRRFVATAAAASAAWTVLPRQLFGQAPRQVASAAQPLRLWYRSAAANWNEALPIGNGRIGIMVWGQTHHEILSLNESTCWSGKPSEHPDNPRAAEVQRRMRAAIAAGNWAEVRKLGPELYSDRAEFGTNLPFGEVLLDLVLPSKQSQDFQRELDLTTGIASVSYTNGDARYVAVDGNGHATREGMEYRAPAGHFRRESFISNPDQIAVVRLTCDQPGQLNFFVSLTAAENPATIHVEENDTLVLDGRSLETLHSNGQNGVALHGRVCVQVDGGTVVAEGRSNRLRIAHANAAVLYMALGTTMTGIDPVAACKRQIADALALGYEKLRQRHVADHQRLFGRVALDLGPAPPAHQPTDVRLQAVRDGATDPALVALLYQYMRYLLIAGSRENSPLPMHLQGIWNDNRCARMPWSCDHHLDINVSMHYWPAESGNLPECVQPLVNWVADHLRAHGRITAREQYGCDGWVAHAMSNGWGYSGAGWGGWAPFVTAGAWIASHLWDHYRFTGDREFLAREAYPVLKEAAQFFLGYMVREPRRGWWVTGPSISPENSFIAPDGVVTPWSMGPTCDIVLVRQLFDSCRAAAEILEVDADFRARLGAVTAQLPPFQVGGRGQLQEWLEDYGEATPGHRHMSHLLSVYPFAQVNVERTPELARAARVTVAGRLGDPHWQDNGWSRAFAAILLVRLGSGDEAYRQINTFIRVFLTNNLLDYAWGGQAGGRYPIFCLDGNGGLAVAVSELLLQDYDGRIKLLPLLPADWKEGHVTGLRTRGGFEVDQYWAGGRLTRAVIRSPFGGRCTVQTRWPVQITGATGAMRVIDGATEIDTRAGDVLVLIATP